MFDFLKKIFKKKEDPAKNVKVSAVDVKPFVNLPVGTPIGAVIKSPPVVVTPVNKPVVVAPVVNPVNKNLIEVWDATIYADGTVQGMRQDIRQTLIFKQSEIGTKYKVRNFINADGTQTDFFPLFLIRSKKMKGKKVEAFQKFLNAKYRTNLIVNSLFDEQTNQAMSTYLKKGSISESDYANLGIRNYESTSNFSNGIGEFLEKAQGITAQAQQGIGVANQVYGYAQSFSAKTPDINPDAEKIAEQQRLAALEAQKLKEEEDAKNAKNTQTTIIIIVAVVVVGVVVWLVLK